MPPPPADQLASRLFLGPALRTQPDRRLVKLVRDGYETAFEEIVRRYRRPLDRFAAAIVGARSEDVTQDAFSKALLALRGSEAEIELRPWLYRIVRNTALNDLRDRPAAAEQLGETMVGGRSAAAEAEGREEIAELMTRLRALPEPQRAAIVMRELEGLSHEEIAASLGISGGAARQVIYRARTALRDGFGLLIPLPLLRLLIDHGAEAAGAGGAVATAGAAGATLGSVGAGGALKLGLATVLVAGSVGAGVAVEQRHEHGDGPPAAEAAVTGEGAELERSAAPLRPAGPAPGLGGATSRGPGGDDGRHGGESGSRHGDDAGSNHGPSLGSLAESGSEPGPSPQPPHEGRGSDRGGPGPSGGGREDSGAGRGHESGRGDGSGHGSGSSGGSGSGGGPGPSTSGDSGPGPRQPSGEDHSGGGHSGGDGGSGGGGGEGESSGSGGGRGGSSSGQPPQAPPPPPEGDFEDSSRGSDD